MNTEVFIMLLRSCCYYVLLDSMVVILNVQKPASGLIKLFDWLALLFRASEMGLVKAVESS